MAGHLPWDSGHEGQRRNPHTARPQPHKGKGKSRAAKLKALRSWEALEVYTDFLARTTRARSSSAHVSV